MASTNPANFANRDKETVKEIASKGGQASHATNVGFAAMDKEKVKEIASMGGKASHQSHGVNEGSNDDEHATMSKAEADPGRNSDGTFRPGSETAKELGKVGGHHSHDNDANSSAEENGRNADGTFKPGSEAAKIEGHKGGVAAAQTN